MEYLVAIAVIVLFCIVYGNWTKNSDVPGPFPLPIVGGAYILLGHTTYRLFLHSGVNGTISVTLLFASAIFLLWYSNYKLWAKYSKIPGPKPVPFLGNLLHFLANDIDVIGTVCSVVKQFNGFAIIWLGNNPILLVSDPEHLRKFFTNPTMIDRADQYDHIAQALDKNSIFCANGDQWKKVRKMMIMAFHPTPNETFLENFLITRKDLFQSLQKRADGSTFPCKLIVRTQLTNSILLSSTGSKLSEDQAVDFLVAGDYLQHMCYVRQFTLHLRYDWLFYRLPSGKKFQKDLNYCKNVISEMVESKHVEMQRMIENGEGIPNLYIYNTFRKFANEPLDVIKSELFNLIITGLDTTANTICYTLLILGLFPEIQERIYQEDREVLKELAGNDLQVADLEKYEFLDRVIKETLRLFPVAPISARKLKEDTFFGEYLVPTGTNIAAVAIYTYRHPDLFPDPLKFNPDRFLPENIEKRHPYAYNPFSAGPRGCPGNRYAMIGMKAILSGIVREFVIKSHYSGLEEALSYAQAEVTLNDKQDFPIKILPRMIG